MAKIKEEVSNELELNFIPIQAARRGGNGGNIKMNAVGMKNLIDKVDSILEDYKKDNEGKCPGVDLSTINKLLGMDRTSIAGVQETLNQRGFNYLRAKKLWFHSNRNNNKTKQFIWLDRENNTLRYENKAEKYESKSLLTKSGDLVGDVSEQNTENAEVKTE